MQIIQASLSHKSIVLKLLDEFRTVCTSKDNPENNTQSESARKFGSTLFEQTIISDSYKIFLAEENNIVIGIITGNRIVQLRKGESSIEVEEFYVKEGFQGKGVAQELMNSMITWGKHIGVHKIRLESGNNLLRAHAFYKKYGFIEYGKAFQKKI